jgi:hypothetical protein
LNTTTTTTTTTNKKKIGKQPQPVYYYDFFSFPYIFLGGKASFTRKGE